MNSLILSILCVLFLTLFTANAEVSRIVLESEGREDNFENLLDYSQTADNPVNNFTSNDHLVGDLPYAENVTPIRESYAGYIKVRTYKRDHHKEEAGLFYWFFPAQEPDTANPPLIIWLQGGPGSSSMIGLFYEMGPLRVTPKLTLTRHEHTWNTKYSMLFIDQPVGTGWSYVGPYERKKGYKTKQVKSACVALNRAAKSDSQRKVDMEVNNCDTRKLRQEVDETNKKHGNGGHVNGYVTDQRGVAKDLLVFLDEFYSKYPDQRKADLYITGESYGGKYVPSFAYAIHVHNEKMRQSGLPDKVFPLAGIAIGNGLTDPESQIRIHGQHAYHLGLVSRDDAYKLYRYAAQAIAQIKRRDYVGALDTRNRLFQYFANVTGKVNIYDIRKLDTPNNWGLLDEFLKFAHVKKSLNVGSRNYFKDYRVLQNLRGDIMKSVAQLFPTLIKHYKVLLYQGNLDFRDGVSGNMEWIYELDFDGAEEFRKKPRKLWKVNNHLAGYTVNHKNLTKAVILNAGHLVPMDQPIPSLDLISRFIENKSL